MEKLKILFVCLHNSARSQMAEAFMKHYGKNTVEACSAGLEPGILNPDVVLVMKEKGLDISKNRTKSVFDFIKQDIPFSHVITVCDEAGAEKCPVFPGFTKRLHWSFRDPGALRGPHEEILSEIRKIRDEIELSVYRFLRNNPKEKGKKF